MIIVHNYISYDLGKIGFGDFVQNFNIISIVVVIYVLLAVIKVI